MSDYRPVEMTYMFKADDVTQYDDLMVRIALRTLLFKSHSQLSLDEVLDIMKSETERLETLMRKGSPSQP